MSVPRKSGSKRWGWELCPRRRRKSRAAEERTAHGWESRLAGPKVVGGNQGMVKLFLQNYLLTTIWCRKQQGLIWKCQKKGRERKRRQSSLAWRTSKWKRILHVRDLPGKSCQSKDLCKLCDSYEMIWISIDLNCGSWSQNWRSTQMMPQKRNFIWVMTRIANMNE